MYLNDSGYLRSRRFLASSFQDLSLQRAGASSLIVTVSVATMNGRQCFSYELTVFDFASRMRIVYLFPSNSAWRRHFESYHLVRPHTEGGERLAATAAADRVTHRPGLAAELLIRSTVTASTAAAETIGASSREESQSLTSSSSSAKKEHHYHRLSTSAAVTRSDEAAFPKQPFSETGDRGILVEPDRDSNYQGLSERHTCQQT